MRKYLVRCNEEVKKLRHGVLFLDLGAESEVGEDRARGRIVCVVDLVEEGTDGL